MPSPAVKMEPSSNVAISKPEPKKSASSVHDVLAEKPPFGSRCAVLYLIFHSWPSCSSCSLPMIQDRFLTEDADVWSKNAWDHVPPPDDQHERIATALTRQRAKPVPEEEKVKYNEKPARHW